MKRLFFLLFATVAYAMPQGNPVLDFQEIQIRYQKLKLFNPLRIMVIALMPQTPGVINDELYLNKQAKHNLIQIQKIRYHR